VFFEEEKLDSAEDAFSIFMHFLAQNIISDMYELN